jgi:hypothetical protein
MLEEMWETEFKVARARRTGLGNSWNLWMEGNALDRKLGEYC